MMMMGRATPKEAVSRSSSSGIVHLMSALHQNAAAVVTSKTNLNGPDQVLQADAYYTHTRSGCVKIRKEENGLASEEPVSVPSLLCETAKVYPEVVALRARRNGEWKTWTYESYLREVEVVSRGFINIGLHRHHSVMVIGPNSPEWIISSLAAIYAGGISVAVNTASSADDIAKAGINCKADLIVVNDEAFMKVVLLIQHKLPDLKAIIQIRGDPPPAEKRRLYSTHKRHIVSWSQLIDIGQDLPDIRLHERLRRIGVNQCCSIVYTSGTDGPAKGVMLSHDNLTWCSKMLLGLVRAPGFNKIPQPGEEVIMSYQTLSLVGTQLTDIFYSILVAGTLCFPDSLDCWSSLSDCDDDDALFDAIAEVQPTVFFGPPLVFEKMYHRLREIKRSTSGLQRLVLNWSNDAMKSKHLRNNAASISAGTAGGRDVGNDSGRVSSSNSSVGGVGGSKIGAPVRKISQVRNALAKEAVIKKYKELLGFGPGTTFLSRGGPLSIEVHKYLASFDILVHETYGQSETCGVISANVPKRYNKLGTSGKPLAGTRVKVDTSGDVSTPFVMGEPGLVLGWGRNVFMGYLNRETDTKASFREDNYVDLKDIGCVDHEGFLSVQGRPNSFITLSSGEIICPQSVEQLVRLELACVHQAVVVGEGQDYLSVMLTLNVQSGSGLPASGRSGGGAEKSGKSEVLTEETQRWFRQARFNVRTVDEVMDGLENGLQHVIQAGIDRVNQRARTLAEMIGDWRIMPRSFTHASGELGLTGSFRRSVITERHSACIASMFLNHKRQLPYSYYSKGSEAMASLSHTSQHIPPQAQLTQIEEEDEPKTSSVNSMDKDFVKRLKVQITRCKEGSAAAEDQQQEPDVGEDRGGGPGAEAAGAEVAGEGHDHDDREDVSRSTSGSTSGSDDEDDGDLGDGSGPPDPEERERQRKDSQQRIMAIVHPEETTPCGTSKQSDQQDISLDSWDQPDLRQDSPHAADSSGRDVHEEEEAAAAERTMDIKEPPIEKPPHGSIRKLSEVLMSSVSLGIAKDEPTW